MNDETVLDEDTRKYELMVIVNPDLGQDAIKKRLDEVRKLLTSAKKGLKKGEIFFEDVWGVRDFAYRIKKHEQGFYAVFDVLMDPQQINEIDTALRLENEILRHMIVTLPFSYEPKSFAVMKEEEPPAEEKKTAGPARRKTVIMEKTAPATVPAEEAAPKEAAKEEEAPKKTVKKKEEKKETTLEDVDAKLKSIIDNPDINF